MCDTVPGDPRGARLLTQPRALADTARGGGGNPFDPVPDMRLLDLPAGVDVVGLDPGDQPGIAHIRSVELDLPGLCVQQPVQHLRWHLTQGHIQIRCGAGGQRLPEPGVRGEIRGLDRPLVQRLVPVQQFVQVDARLGTEALAGAASPLAQVEGVGPGPAGAGGGIPRVEHPQQRVRIGRGAHGGTRVRPHAFLVHHDRGRQVFQHLDIRARHRGHEGLDEGGVGFVDQPLRLGGNRAEHQRGLARPGDPGEGGDPALGNIGIDTGQVVLPRLAHADHVMGVCRMLAHGFKTT